MRLSTGNTLYYVTNDYFYLFNTETLKVQHLPISVFGSHSLNYGTKAIAVDNHNRVWAVSYRPHSAVSIYDVGREKAYSVDEMDKYLIYGLVPTDEQTMWFTTDKGFVSVKATGSDSLRFEVVNYPMTGSNEGIFNDRAITMLSDHRLLAGSTDGAELNGRVLYECDLPYLKTLRLAYNENNVRLEYAMALGKPWKTARSPLTIFPRAVINYMCANSRSMVNRPRPIPSLPSMWPVPGGLHGLPSWAMSCCSCFWHGNCGTISKFAIRNECIVMSWPWRPNMSVRFRK